MNQSLDDHQRTPEQTTKRKKEKKIITVKFRNTEWFTKRKNRFQFFGITENGDSKRLIDTLNKSNTEMNLLSQ